MNLEVQVEIVIFTDRFSKHLRKIKMRNEQIMELSDMKKGVNEIINVSILRMFGHMESMNDSRSVGWIYIVVSLLRIYWLRDIKKTGKQR